MLALSRSGFLWWLLCVQVSPYAWAGPGQVGVGDSREGYETKDYATASTTVAPVADGRVLNLAQRAAQPRLGLPPLHEPLDSGVVDLGRRLFFDRRLSANGTLSCGMCHVPEQGFTQNELATPVGIEGRSVRRNAPSLYEVAYRPALFFDGRSDSLEEQIWEPLLADNEMGNAARDAVLARLRADGEYSRRFDEVFEDGLSELSLGRALAGYQRGLIAGDSPFDQWFYAGLETLTEQQQHGFRVFRRSGCAACHEVGKNSAPFTDEGFYNTGIGARAQHRSQQPERIQIAPGKFVPLAVEIELVRQADDGRAEVTGVARDRWKYRTPGLRNVALTAPYMHDGSIGTLREVVEYYDAGGFANPGLDFLMVPLNLVEADKASLVAFLEALTGMYVDALAADARGVAIGDNM